MPLRNPLLMNKAYTYLLYLFLFLTADQVFGQAHWDTFRNWEHQFRFTYPGNWKIKIPRGPNVRGSIAAPSGNPIASCNIVVRRVPALNNFPQVELNKELSSVTYSVSDWTSALGDKFPDVRILSRKKVKIDNQPGQYAIVSFSYETIQIKIYTKAMMFLTFTPGYVWNFLCAGAGLDPIEANESFNYWLPSFNGIFSSFVFEQ